MILKAGTEFIKLIQLRSYIGTLNFGVFIKHCLIKISIRSLNSVSFKEKLLVVGFMDNDPPLPLTCLKFEVF